MMPRMTLRNFLLPLAFLTLSAAAAPAQQVQTPLRTPDVIFVPTPQEVVDVMLKIAKVTKNDVVYDLGSGDGRIPITAAKTHGARAVGIDIDPVRIREANENLKQAASADPSITNRVRFLNQDLFTTDISEATVVTLYLLPSQADSEAQQGAEAGHPGRVARLRHGPRHQTGHRAGERQRPDGVLLHDSDRLRRRGAW
jgi:hypothetical protein